MQRARSVAGPLRRAHPASGATWNVQVVREKMSSQCLWHACRALSAGLLLMLLGAAMAVIGYYADFLSVDQEIRGNATVSVKDEARGFHLNNLSYVGPIVMGFGGFIVVAACVMTFEARDSAAKVTPARPTAMPRPLPRRGPPCAAPARLDTLGVYRLPHVLPLPHSLPLVPLHRHRPSHVKNIGEREKLKGKARFGSAPDLRSGSVRATLPVAALRRPLRRYALSVDEPPQSAVSASAVESECGSQSSLALDLHASGACAGVTLRVRDNTRRRPLARQQRLQDDTLLATPRGSTYNINNTEETAKTPGAESNATIDTTRLSVENEWRASSAPPPTRNSAQHSPMPSPTLNVISPLESEHTDKCITIKRTEQEMDKPHKQEMEKQTNALRCNIREEIAVLPREVVLNIDIGELMALNDEAEEGIEGQVQLQIMVAMAPGEGNPRDGENGAAAVEVEVTGGQETGETTHNDNFYEDNARALPLYRRLSETVEVTGYPSLFELNTREEFSLERLQEELEIDVISLLTFHRSTSTDNLYMEQEVERQPEEITQRQYEEPTEQQSEEATEREPEERAERQSEEATETQSEEEKERHTASVIKTQNPRSDI